jgi:hypothetical protein
MSTRKTVIAAFGAATLAASAGGLAVAQLNPIGGPGGAGGGGGGGGTGGTVGFSGNTGCDSSNTAGVGGPGVITRSPSKCGKVQGKTSVKKIANGGKGGKGGNGGKGGPAFNRF